MISQDWTSQECATYLLNQVYLGPIRIIPIKMCECVKCKQTGRFFDKNGLDFWYFVDLFRTISREHE